MDFFEIPDDYKPEKPLSMEEMDEITNYLKGHPLFLKEMPQDISNNEHLQALQALMQEEDPAVTAENLNKQANSRLQQGPNSPYYLKDAYEKYTKAIKLKCNNALLNAKLHSNRAAINLKFKNYGKVIEDCRIAIQLAPDYLKAYYRMARAYIALNKYADCIQLLQQQTDQDLVALRKQAEALQEQAQQQAKKKEESKSEYNAQVEAYFQQRQWKLGKVSRHLPEGVKIEFIDGHISIPLIVIYPQFSQFDLVAKTHQKQRVGECLQQLLENPLPWESQREYLIGAVEVFLELEEGVLLRLPPQATISELAARRPVNGAIELTVIANNQFGAHFKQQHKIY